MAAQPNSALRPMGDPIWQSPAPVARQPVPSRPRSGAVQPSAVGASGSLFTLSEMILLSCITCWLKAA
jgi:hypothetical protein